MTDFLPKDYEVPDKPGNYMKLEQGENRLRILSAPILGRERWADDKDGNRKPVRTRMDDDLTPDEFEESKHFWAMVIWNYEIKAVQILQITQSTIQKPLTALAKSKDWGDPKGIDGYDIVITKAGEKLETEYQVMPQPKKKIDEGIIKMAEDMNIKLEALFENEDPFGSESEDLAKEVAKKV